MYGSDTSWKWPFQAEKSAEFFGPKAIHRRTSSSCDITVKPLLVGKGSKWSTPRGEAFTPRGIDFGSWRSLLRLSEHFLPGLDDLLQRARMDDNICGRPKVPETCREIVWYLQKIYNRVTIGFAMNVPRANITTKMCKAGMLVIYDWRDFLISVWISTIFTFGILHQNFQSMPSISDRKAPTCIGDGYCGRKKGAQHQHKELQHTGILSRIIWIWHLADFSKFPKHIWTLNFPWKFLLALDPEIGSEMTEGTSKTEEPWVIKFRPSQFHTPQPWFFCSSVKFLKTPCTECFYKEGWLSSVLSFPKDSPVDASFWLLNLHPPHRWRWVPTSDKWSYHPKKWGC